VGDSFWTLPDAMISRARLSARNDFFYYFNEFALAGDPTERKATHPGELHSGMSWDYVFSADAVIIEVIEAAIGDAGYGFVDQARRSLRQAKAASPPPAAP
jgi:hypothetical protein